MRPTMKEQCDGRRSGQSREVQTRLAGANVRNLRCKRTERQGNVTSAEMA